MGWVRYAISLFLLTGCERDLRIYSGSYVAQAVKQTGASTQTDEGFFRAWSEDPRVLFLRGRLKNQSPREELSWKFQANQSTSTLSLTAKGEFNFVTSLRRKPHLCFESMPSIEAESAGYFAKVCFEKESPRLTVRNSDTSLEIILRRAGPNDFPFLEAPAVYTSSELRDRAARFGFESRLSFEKLVRSKLDLSQSRLNLIPHLSAGSALNIGAYDLRGVITSVGELVPFLFPSNWINIRENQHLVRAQTYATTIVKLDSMQMVESLSIALGRDKRLWTRLKEDRRFHSEIENKIQALENEKKIDLGSSLAIRSAGNNLDQTIATLESVIPLEATALTYLAGFTNPEAVDNVRVIPLGNIEDPPELDEFELQNRAIHSAPELLQVYELIAAAQANKQNRGFQWLSPTGDSQGALGFGLPDYIEVGASKIRDLEVFRDRVHSILLRKVVDAFNDYYKSLDSYQFAVKGVALQEKRIETAQMLLEAGVVRNAHNLRDALQLLAINHANLLSAQYTWYDSLSRLQRLQTLGAYEIENDLRPKPGFHFHLDETASSVSSIEHFSN